MECPFPIDNFGALANGPRGGLKSFSSFLVLQDFSEGTKPFSDNVLLARKTQFFFEKGDLSVLLGRYLDGC